MQHETNRKLLLWPLDGVSAHRVRPSIYLACTLHSSPSMHSGTLRNCLPLDATAIDEALSTRYTQHIQHLSQVEHGTGSRIGLYFRVVGTHALGVVPSFYSCRLSHGVLVRFLRFRLGCHHLRIHTGRWQLPALLRPQRTCLRCSSTAVDDEAHCLFLCEHPTIVEARDIFLSAVVPPVSALSSLRYADFWALYSTGRVPLPVLVKYVAICVRVGRQCHRVWWY